MIETLTQAPTAALRALWPDEVDRLGAHFPRVPLNTPRPAWSRALEASAPKRVIGLAALHAVPPPSTETASERLFRLTWEVRAAWQEHPCVVDLLQAAIAEARRLDCSGLVTSVEVTEPLREIALAQGFEERSRQEVWSVKVAATRPWLDGRVSRLLEDWPAPVAPIGEDQLEPVRHICTQTALLGADRVRLMSVRHPDGLDPELCFFTGDPAKPSAILLGREHLGKGYLEVLARDPELKDLPMSAILALLREFVKGLQDRGLTELTCAVRPGSLPGLVPLIERFGAQRIEGVVTLRHDL